MDYVTRSPKSDQKNQNMGPHSISWCIYVCSSLIVWHIRHFYYNCTICYLKSVVQLLSECWTLCLKHSKPFHRQPYLALNFILPQFYEFYFHICLTVLCFNKTFATHPHGCCERLCFTTDSLFLILYVAKKQGVISQWLWGKMRGDQEVYASENHLKLWSEYERLYMLSK